MATENYNLRNVVELLRNNPQDAVGAWKSIKEMIQYLTSAGIWDDGNGAPSANYGLNGQYYNDLTLGDVYRKVNNAWVLVGNLKGTGMTPINITVAAAQALVTGGTVVPGAWYNITDSSQAINAADRILVQGTSASAFDQTAVYVDNVNSQRNEITYILDDTPTDLITFRTDIYGNLVWGAVAIANFPWGNGSVVRNKVTNSAVTSTGQIIDCTIGDGCTIDDGGFNITGCTFPSGTTFTALGNYTNQIFTSTPYGILDATNQYHMFGVDPPTGQFYIGDITGGVGGPYITAPPAADAITLATSAASLTVDGPNTVVVSPNNIMSGSVTNGTRISQNAAIIYNSETVDSGAVTWNGQSVIRVAKFHLTSADIQSGNTSPIVLIPSAGAGTAIYARHDTTALITQGGGAMTAATMDIISNTGTSPHIRYDVNFLGSALGNIVKGDDSVGVNKDDCIIPDKSLQVIFDADNPGFTGSIDIYLEYSIITL